MDIDFDPHRQAEVAMKEAANADGFERQRRIAIAQAWLELARLRLPPTLGRSNEGAGVGPESFRLMQAQRTGS